MCIRDSPETENGGAADLAAATSATGHDGSALDADKRPHEDQDTLDDLVGNAAEAGAIGGKHSGIALDGTPEISGEQARVCLLYTSNTFSHFLPHTPPLSPTDPKRGSEQVLP